ncbi:AI-2E family transporter [Clostridium homopropionicum]|uniref:AI-2E family transporter n=1 Tax=Clostridium homopropionicum TaxID=36844 RepID=UPI001FA82915|nr:AI-2E family transporter [Clostridium homopropionicum]
MIFVLVSLLIKHYFTAFFIIFFMYFLSKPVYEFLSKIKIFNKNLNAVISLVIINLIIFFIIFYIGKIFINEAYFLFKKNYTNFIQGMENAIQVIYNFFNIDLFDLNNKIKNFYLTLSYESFIKKGAVYTTESILDYFISNIAVYFILVDKYVILNSILKIISDNKLKRINEKIDEINKYLKIQLIIIILTTLVTFLGFISLNIKSSLQLAIFCGVLDLVPYIGTIVIFVPLIIYKFITNNKIIAFGIIILYILIQIVRQIAEAKFVSNKLNVHPLAMLLGTYVGVKILGIVGLFTTPLYILVTKEILFSTYDRS